MAFDDMKLPELEAEYKRLAGVVDRAQNKRKRLMDEINSRKSDVKVQQRIDKMGPEEKEALFLALKADLQR